MSKRHDEKKDENQQGWMPETDSGKERRRDQNVFSLLSFWFGYELKRREKENDGEGEAHGGEDSKTTMHTAMHSQNMSLHILKERTHRIAHIKWLLYYKAFTRKKIG